ncbi:AdoMet-homocysteine methyltransferase [Oleoguttula sp. CCFEE 5521]
MGLTVAKFTSLIETDGVLVIDGALATELETRGHDLSHPLWSGKVLKENPEVIQDVHREYFLAGANIAITASYQASALGLREHLGLNDHEAGKLIARGVELAHNARTEPYAQGVPAGRPLLVAGSVGPYGAYLADGSEYRGDYKVSAQALADFHRPRIQALLDAGADLLAIETIPSVSEVEVLLELLRDEFPSCIAWLSCTLRDAEHLSDGTPIHHVLEAVHSSNAMQPQIVAFGINCVPPDRVTPCLKLSHAATELPLLCYPNSGEVYVAKDHAWTGSGSTTSLRDQTLDFKAAGAQLIDIRAVADALHS